MRGYLFSIWGVVCLSIIISCGESNTETEKNNLDSAVKLSLFGKTLNVKDDLYELSCNQFYVNFLYSRDHPTCTAVTVTNDYQGSWTIKSSDEKIDLTPTELTESNQLVIGENTYFCYLYPGSLFKESGEEIFFNTGHIVLSKSSASRPSDLNIDDVDYIGGQSALCETLH